MYIEYFYVLLLLTLLCFFYALLSSNFEHRQIFSILCIPLLIGLSISSLSLEKVTEHVVGTEVIEHTTYMSSTVGAYIFGFLALLEALQVWRLYIEEKNNARE